MFSRDIHLKLIIAFLITTVFFYSCTSDNRDHYRLKKLDSQINIHPEAILDSLNGINKRKLSIPNRAYYELLNVISSDRLRIYPPNDSLIKMSVKVFARQGESYNYARALLYQGIIRYRMKKYDSTTIVPIKKSVDIFLTQSPLNTQLLQKAYYYLGLTHEKYNNSAMALHYFKESLSYAKQDKDSLKGLSIYLELCWNRIVAKDFRSAKLYMDTLLLLPYKGTAYEEYRENTCAVYYSRTGQPEKSLEVNRRILQSDLKEKNNFQDLRIDYYNISCCYRSLHLIDSALYYARMSVSQIKDSTNALNYDYHRNVAEIADSIGLSKVSAESYKHTYIALKQSMQYQTNTQLMEAEKKYDKSLAEKKSMELLHHNQMLYTIILLIGLLLLILFLLSHQRKLKHANRIGLMEQERLRIEQQNLKYQQELQEKIHCEQFIQRENDEKKFILELFQYTSNRYAETQKNLQGVSEKLIREYPQIHERLTKELTSLQKEFDLINEKFINDEIFCRFTGIECQQPELTNNEKTLMVLLACNATSMQIALLLGTSTASLRVRKHNLRNKLVRLNIQLPDYLAIVLNSSNST